MFKLLCGAKWLVGLALLAFAVAGPIAGQTPSPDQVRQSLENPGMAQTVRKKIQDSGLTPDQIRARLQANGYPAQLLDQFLTPGLPGDTTAPAQNQLGALGALGLAPAPTDFAVPAPPALTTITPGALPHSKVFGVEVFRRNTTQFQPQFTGPVPPDYRLGGGDVLALILSGNVELIAPIQITREGFGVIPQVGQVSLANLTVDQAKSVLLTRLRRVYSGVGTGPDAPTRFDLSVSSVRAIQVYTVGEVVQPGAYQMSSLGTALSALYASGGITETADARRIEIRRSGGVVATLDLYDYLLRGDTHSDVTLQNADVVFVPLRTRRVAVFGHVVREGYYDVKPTETLRDVMRAAGGSQPDAESRVNVLRSLPLSARVAGGPSRTVIDATPAAGDSLVPALPMEDGDSIAVVKLGSQRRGFVRIGGTVFQPGEYGLEVGMHLSELIAHAGGLEPATYRGRAHISRLDQTDSTRSLVSVVLPAAGGDQWTDDPLLQDYDSVTVYGRPEMRDNVTIAISGMVNRPGSYSWRDGMTLRDAVLMAHSLQPGAMLDSVEIARLPVDRSGGQLATTLRVPIDSTYLFDQIAPGGGVLPPGMPFRGHGAPEIPLKPYDNILVFAQPEFEFQRAVYIGGEVKFPGTYALRNKSERLITLVRRAGGLTNQAYPEGIVFTRHVRQTGRINIDLRHALRDSTSSDNVILQPGDSVLIPEYQPSVRVTGSVNSPGSILYRRGEGLAYYVSGAGGYAKNADGGRTSVRAANGAVRTRSGRVLFFFRGDGPEPGPGSEIFVPAKDASQLVRTDKVALFGAIASILASALTTIVVLRR